MLFRSFLTSYMLGAPSGRNLGAAGYSHEFVARLFRPLLERFGAVREIRDPRRDLQAAVDDCIRRGQRPVHFSVLPFQDVTLAANALNIVMPAWEFPDVPNEAFDGNAQNDWPATANRCDLVIVSGPFTENALRRGGATTPISIVPVPSPRGYFDLPRWRSGQVCRIGCPAYVFTESTASSAPLPHPGRRRWKKYERLLRSASRSLFGAVIYDRCSAWIRTKRNIGSPSCRESELYDLPYPKTRDLTLSGVVYTSIFNPDDGRKNWQDLLTAWTTALADRSDATLVCKLITSRPRSIRKVLEFFRGSGLRHRCRVVFVCGFLTDAQMLELCRASTYYVQATKAEGNCLPLMNYLAAGRPGISPDHSSMGDYFDEDSGFVVESHPEPAAWPHDSSLRLRTTWGRIVWTSLRDRIADAHRVVTESAGDYERLSESCRTSMQSWSGTAAVMNRLDAALRLLLASAGQVKPDMNSTDRAAA